MKFLIARFRLLSDAQQFMLLCLFVSMCVIANPFTQIFNSGKAYIILSSLITEPQFAGIATFCFFLYVFSIVDGSLKFQFWANILAASFWGLQFAVFIVAQDFGGYITWILPCLGLLCIRLAAKIAILDEIYG